MVSMNKGHQVQEASVEYMVNSSTALHTGSGGDVLPPGYKKTEVGIIPENWEALNVESISIKIGSGITPKGGSTGYKASGRPFVRSQNVGWGELRLDDLVYITEETHQTFPTTELFLEDVLLNITGASIGRSSIVNEKILGGNVNQHVCVIRINKSISEPKFLNYLLLSSLGQTQIDSYQAGGNREGLNFSQIKSLKFAFPKKQEQTAIANALSDVDALIAGLEKLISKKSAIKTAAMQQLLTGKKRLPPFDQLPHTAKITRPAYKQTELGEIPEDWEVTNIGSFAPLQRGFDLPSKLRIDGKYPVVYSNGIVNYHQTFQTKGPGIVTGRSGTLGKVHFIESDFWPHNTSLWVTKFNNADPKFVYYLYLRVGFNRFASGSGVPTLNRNDAHSFKLAVPTSIKEQTAIAKVLSDMDQELQALQQRLQKTRQIKQGMMQELLTGKTRLV